MTDSVITECSFFVEFFGQPKNLEILEQKRVWFCTKTGQGYVATFIPIVQVLFIYMPWGQTAYLASSFVI